MSTESGPGRDDTTTWRSHLVPRTAAGRRAAAAFIGLMVLAQPPIVHGLANRIEPRLLSMPFLYVYLGVLYFAMIGVLLWAYRKRL